VHVCESNVCVFYDGAQVQYKCNSQAP